MNPEPILFVEETLTEEHPKMDFVAIRVKSGSAYYNFCLPADLAEGLYNDLLPVIERRIALRKKREEARAKRDANMETTSGSAD